MKLFKTQSEKRLASLLVSVLGIVAILVVGVRFFSYRNYLRTHLAEIENEQLDAQGWLADRGLWEQRVAWLGANQPVLKAPREESVAFLELVESSAKKSGVEVAAKSMQEMQKTDQWTGVPIRIEGNGKFSAIAQWLHELQKPRNFVVIQEMTLKSGSSQDLVNCSMQLVRCYQPMGEMP